MVILEFDSVRVGDRLRVAKTTYATTAKIESRLDDNLVWFHRKSLLGPFFDPFFFALQLEFHFAKSVREVLIDALISKGTQQFLRIEMIITPLLIEFVKSLTFFEELLYAGVRCFLRGHKSHQTQRLRINVFLVVCGVSQHFCERSGRENVYPQREINIGRV